MVGQFRKRYPTGSLCGELIAIHEGQYLVRAVVEADGMRLASAMAMAASVEVAEDRARERALALLALEDAREDATPTPSPSVASAANPETQPVPPLDTPATSTPPSPEPPPVSPPVTPSPPAATTPPTDDSDLMVQTTLELRRLGWDAEQGRTYLEQTYGKRSRQHLSRAELESFLGYLQTQPTPPRT